VGSRAPGAGEIGEEEDQEKGKGLTVFENLFTPFSAADDSAQKRFITNAGDLKTTPWI
jgi:hypothetical protein